MSEIRIRSLQGVDFDVMAEAFNDAFSDYNIPARYTVEYLRDLVTRRGYRPDLAVGAFDGGRLVGFVFNCLDGDAAYNSGTGTAISHRRRGVARRLMQRSIETLPAKRYVLEVIESNERAAALYRDLGFVETRRVQCWTYEGAAAPLPASSIALETIRSWCDFEPTWQNSLASIRRSLEPYTLLGDERGAVVVFPSTGDVPLLAVPPSHRRQRRGRALLAAAHAAAGKRLRVMNIDDRATGVNAFLAACGAQRLVRQIEMVIALPGAAS